MQKSRVLISGATGWLGREILNIFSETNFDMAQINLISSKTQEVLVKGNKFEAKSFENYQSIEPVNSYFDFAFLAKNKLDKVGPEKYKEINLKIISNSINLIKRIRPKTVILSSSGAIYNMKKDSKYESLYSDLKKIQEELITKACDANSSNLIISRIFNLSGRGIPADSNFALADLMIKSIKGMDLIISSNYLVTRRYSDITQLLKLLVKMAHIEQDYVFDSGGTKVELRFLANEIIRVTNSKSKVITSEIKSEAQQDDYFSYSNAYENLLTSVLGEEPVAIEKQIQNTKNYLVNIV
jgi:nucleoside-diphosphate-sugar epimerase